MKTLKKVALLISLSALALFFSTQATEAAKKYGVLQEETNRTFVPIRYVSETFGYKVDWDAATQTVKVSESDYAISLKVGSNKANVNGKEKSLDAPPTLLGGSLYVPLRFVAEQFGTEVAPIATNKVKLKNSKLETIIETVAMKRFQQAIANPVTTGSSKIKVGSKSISVNTVYVDLYHPTLEIDAFYANNKIGTVQPFKEMVENSKAKVAVNGAFFDAYSDSAYKHTYGYLVKDGEVIAATPLEKRAVFVYTKDFDVKIVSSVDFHDLLNKEQVKTAIQAGPLLVKDGKVVVDTIAEGFKDPKILTSRGARSAIGVTKDQKLIIVTTNAASIPELAETMLQLKVTEAMNLDGGASSALYASGKYITPAGRELNNILTVHY